MGKEEEANCQKQEISEQDCQKAERDANDSKTMRMLMNQKFESFKVAIILITKYFKKHLLNLEIRKKEGSHFINEMMKHKNLKEMME